jgi:teichoic acid transport system permease protein
MTASNQGAGGSSDALSLAREHGLAPVGVKPRFLLYLRRVWERRQFAWTLARSRVTARNEGDFLGAAWTVLRPLLTAGVYFVVFGYILDTSRGIENFIAFLTIGVFVFTYTAQTVVTGSKSVTANLALVRALHFPRAVLPLSATLVQFIEMRVTVPVMIAIAWTSGERISWEWLLLFPALLVQTVFNLGLALLLARAVTQVRDIAQLLPFATRMWLYLSGVFFSLDRFSGHGLASQLLYLNPANIYISLYRGAVMQEIPITGETWILGVLFAVISLTVGVIYFWRGEGSYGRG